MLSKEEYDSYCSRFKKAWGFLKKYSIPQPQVIEEVCELRTTGGRVYEVERMRDILETAEFIYLNEDKCDIEKLKVLGDDLALFSHKGNFLLSGRYIFPVKDMIGNVVALIGWYPDEKKYVTTPSRLFSKNCMFYGLEQLGNRGKIGGKYFLVEGIFDSLSIRSLGYNAIAQMGISDSKYKQLMYSLFGRIIAIPDADRQGREVIQKNKWNIPSNASYFKWSGIPWAKDIDDIVNGFEYDDVKEMLGELWNDKSRIITLNM